MENKKIVLNFLVFADKIAEGKLQSELLQEASDLGFRYVEIRREYFKNIEKEIPTIQSEAKRLNLQLFYSVPDEIYIKGEVNPKLQDYLDESKKMGVKHIKWNIGDFEGNLHKEKLIALCTEGIAISIENDQTQTSGSIEAIDAFMKAVNESNIDIGYVYDIGNWRFVGEDEIKAAKLLKEYVHYIHMKDVDYKDGKPQAACLGHGEIDWHKVLKILPNNVPVAIEYPTVSNDEILEAKKLLEEVF